MGTFGTSRYSRPAERARQVSRFFRLTEPTKTELRGTLAQAAHNTARLQAAHSTGDNGDGTKTS